MPAKCAPASAAIRWPSPVLLLAPSSRDRNAVPPVARITAEAAQAQPPPSCSRIPAAPATPRPPHPHAPGPGVPAPPVGLAVPLGPVHPAVQLGQPAPHQVHGPVHPPRIGQAAARGGPPLDLGGPGRPRHPPVPDPGGGRDPGRPAVALVHEDHARALLGGRQRRPGPGQATADDQDVGGERGRLGPGREGPAHTSAAAGDQPSAGASSVVTVSSSRSASAGPGTSGLNPMIRSVARPTAGSAASAATISSVGPYLVFSRSATAATSASEPGASSRPARIALARRLAPSASSASSRLAAGTTAREIPIRGGRSGCW